MKNNTPPAHFVAPSLEGIAPHFPSYEMEHFIAQGGMGAVYQARQISLDRQVAIKILPREFGQDETFRASFEAEAKAMAKLNHPNLIGVYDFGEVDGMLFLIMEYVNGKSLFHSSHGIAIEPAQAAEIVSAICHGLEHAHAAGILHRDVKPANILLTPDATPKIGDFGLAGPIDAAASDDEVVYGTPGYTAPEVISRGAVDHRADIFSTGVILHELLTGSLPDSSSTPPSTISGCPASFDSIVARSTHANPEMRFASAGEMAKALEGAATTSPLAHLNLSTAPPTLSPAAALPTKKNNTGPLIGTLLAVAALVAAAAFLLPKDKPAEPTKSPVTTTAPEKPDASTQTNTPPPTPTPVITASIKPTQTKETTLDALNRLQAKLAAGKRDEFPPQTIEHQGNHFLLVKKNMNWSEAQKFATKYSAHLAVLADSDAREKIARSLGVTQPAWLAAGMAARDAWQWMDGSPWDSPNQPKPATASDRAILINSGGTLVARPPGSDHALILQWRKDASDPCTLDAQLTRTIESIKDSGIDQAIYPVGTRTLDKSHFLLLDQSLSWESAHQLAKSHSAHLAVPSSPAEHTWLMQTYAGKADTAWLGGYLLDEQSPWRWITGEKFSSLGWKTGEPSHDAGKTRILIHLDDSSQTSSWTSSEGNRGDASHILLEWSKPAPAASSTAKFDLKKWLTGVNRKIAARVSPIIEQYNKEREQEINSYIRDMKRAAKKFDFPDIGRGRGRGGRGGNFLKKLVEDAMEKVEKTGELPDIPERAPGSLTDLTNKTKSSLDKLDKEHQTALTKELEFYTQGLLKKATAITQDGFTRQAASIRKTINDIGSDTAKFTSALGL